MRGFIFQVMEGSFYKIKKKEKEENRKKRDEERRDHSETERMIDDPDSLYSSSVIHCFWNSGWAASTEPPRQEENLRRG